MDLGLFRVESCIKVHVLELRVKLLQQLPFSSSQKGPLLFSVDRVIYATDGRINMARLATTCRRHTRGGVHDVALVILRNLVRGVSEGWLFCALFVTS